MNKYVSVNNMKIPIEYTDMYKEVSDLFEKKVMDAIKQQKEKQNVQNKKVSKKLNHSRRLHQSS